MLQKIKQLFPSSLKNNLRKRFRDEVFKIKDLDPNLIKKVAALEKEVFELQPEIVKYTEEIKDALNKNSKANNVLLPQNLNISKHDYMYQFLKEHYHDSLKAYVEYITSGAHMISILKTVAAKKWNSFANVNRFLDFASGYGRLTRYVIETIKPGQVWISDIKKGAVEFQTQQFGVHGIISNTMPDKFEINETFDFIFVGSLFSHLPEDAFVKWLKHIYGLLNNDGVLVFTVHDQTLMKHYNPSANKGKLIYSSVSEELNLLSKDGRLPGEQYGTAYVDEDFVADSIKSINNKPLKYCRYKKGMWALQDIYILPKNANEDFANLIL